MLTQIDANYYKVISIPDIYYRDRKYDLSNDKDNNTACRGCYYVCYDKRCSLNSNKLTCIRPIHDIKFLGRVHEDED